MHLLISVHSILFMYLCGLFVDTKYKSLVYKLQWKPFNVINDWVTIKSSKNQSRK